MAYPRLSRFLYLLGLIGFLACLPVISMAQSNVSVRTGSHDDYSRVVFDWPQAATYEISKSGERLILSFDQQASVNVDDLNSQKLKNIGTFSVLSGAGAPLKLSLQILPASDFRHFKIGNRVVIDVYNAPGQMVKKEPVVVPEKAVAEQETPEQPSQQELETAVDASQDEPEQQNTGGVPPHVITLSTTQTIGVAAFERAGYLWLVVDDPTLQVPPKISGPSPEKFPKFEKVKIAGGQAYRMKKPEGYYFYGEGGGLLWRLVMTPNPRRVKSQKAETKHEGTDMLTGGTVVWPLRNIRKVLSVIDPVVGDEIKMVTVEDAAQLSGDQRQYVEFETLPSFVGLALVPKADDIQVSSSVDGISVTRPMGLALSPKRDTAAAVLKDDVQEEEEAFTAEEKAKQMSRIFNFARWEMGGVIPLEENRRVIMVGIGAKEGHAKVEDLITLAKLNVANDRGQEALGLLRVAANELPGVEEGAEYIALRGAAAALAGKPDEAIEDLAAPVIQQYGEIGYWKAFALAGLEDWRQADKVLPRDLDILFDYPKQIRQPMALALAEVALRSANTDVAETLLSTLEPEYKKMSLARQAAWIYLNGELKRQINEPEDALKNWMPLLTGRDDYYRAKAGLSVTKMQLARQKITPAKAIDRLEGLRYAWRGDELETLINYRLGEVYVENNDYLKGLSVLRNAISLSPDSNMAQEVTEYMTDTFRTLFAEDKLKDVSPLDAVSIYDEFKELTPVGTEGDQFVQKLAERLVDVDLLGRASALLEHQLEHRLKGEVAGKVAIRLAAIQLLDSKPENALKTLKIADDSFGQANAAGPKDYRKEAREILLLRARALSKTDQIGGALASLKGIKDDLDVTRLRADIAWNSGRWEEAAEAFQDLVVAENISMTRPMNEYQANLILNRSIALNLAGDRVALSNLRERYGDLMLQTEKSQLFDLVTRPRQLGLLGNRDSVLSLISEVDMFGDFLESYKKVN